MLVAQPVFQQAFFQQVVWGQPEAFPQELPAVALREPASQPVAEPGPAFVLAALPYAWVPVLAAPLEEAAALEAPAFEVRALVVRPLAALGHAGLALAALARVFPRAALAPHAA